MDHFEPLGEFLVLAPLQLPPPLPLPSSFYYFEDPRWPLPSSFRVASVVFAQLSLLRISSHFVASVVVVVVVEGWGLGVGGFLCERIFGPQCPLCSPMLLQRGRHRRSWTLNPRRPQAPSELVKATSQRLSRLLDATSQRLSRSLDATSQRLCRLVSS
jgi:hypothetical protein